MKFSRLTLILGLLTFLAACGHGYEGKYETKVGSKNEFMDAFSKLGVASQTLVIGSDYLEANGERTEFDDIFVRKSGNEKYLVFKSEEGEEAWKIIDDNTLQQGNEFMSINLVRVN